MRLKWIVAALLLCLSSLLVVGRAAAQTTYTNDSLAALLLSTSDVNTVLSTLGSSDSVTDSAQGPSVTAPLANASEVFKTNSGIIGIALFSNPDGSNPSSDEQNSALSGQLLNLFANGVFSNVANFALGGSGNVGDADQSATFSGSLQGVDLNVVADSFLKGNIFGVVFYATPGQTDATVVGGVAQMQIMKFS